MGSLRQPVKKKSRYSMSVPAMNYKGLLPLLALFLLMFAGCAGPLEVKYEPKTDSQFKSKEPAAIFVAPFEDKRDLSKSPFKNPKTIGRIEATVSNMSGEELTISENVTETVAGAYRKELAIAGFTVVPEKDNARYILSGEVREFRLDVGSRDTVAIELAYAVEDAQTKKLISSGVESVREDRFAGVMGNSRTSLSNYIAASLQKVIRRSIAAAGANLSGEQNSPAPGKDATAPSNEALGKISVTTSPQRAKVYIDGVYYGLTPIAIDLAPGVYEVTVKQKGFHTVSEKVSVRQNGATEMETELEKE
jgi:hypothetical protein